MAKATDEALTLEIDGHTVNITHPERVAFPTAGLTKRDLVTYYLKVGEAVMRGIKGRPMLLKRYPRGAEADPFYQQHAPSSRPEFVETTHVEFGGGGEANQVVCANLATIAWAINLGCIEPHPQAVRVPEVDNPDELRVDLDPGEQSTWADLTEVATGVRDVLADVGLHSFPKTSGSRGIHIQVPIRPEHEFMAVRRAAIALAREVERRLPHVATAAWWKEERGGRIFLDYNQNARGRTTAAAYSVRATPEARVSCPVTWSDLPSADPTTLTLTTVPQRVEQRGDPLESMQHSVGSLDGLLEWVKRDEANGLGDAPWPPHYRRVAGEPVRAAPSRRRKT